MTTCGATKAVNGARTWLVCNLDVDHDGDHGMRRLPSLPPYVTWSATK